MGLRIGIDHIVLNRMAVNHNTQGVKLLCILGILHKNCQPITAYPCLMDRSQSLFPPSFLYFIVLAHAFKSFSLVALGNVRNSVEQFQNGGPFRCSGELGNVRNLSMEQGIMTKIKREQGNFASFEGTFSCTDSQVFLCLGL